MYTAPFPSSSNGEPTANDSNPSSLSFPRLINAFPYLELVDGLCLPKVAGFSSFILLDLLSWATALNLNDLLLNS